MANFPTSVSTTDQLHTGVNNLATSLTSAINAIVTTIPVSDTSDFPVVGAITIDTERISYTSTDGTNFLGCTRGFGNTSAVSHLISRPVEFTYGAEFHNDIRDEIIAIEQFIETRIGLLGAPLTFSTVASNDDNTNTILYYQGLQAAATIQSQSTNNVSTSAKTIFNSGGQCCFILVTGISGGNTFCDLIFASLIGGTVAVINSHTVSGSPATRTYSIGTGIDLTMSTGTYGINTIALGASFR